MFKFILSALMVVGFGTAAFADEGTPTETPAAAQDTMGGQPGEAAGAATTTEAKPTTKAAKHAMKKKAKKQQKPADE